MQRKNRKLYEKIKYRPVYLGFLRWKLRKKARVQGGLYCSNGVSLAATMIAKKRGLDPELAAMAAMLHDLHAYKSGSYDDHAHLGAALAREILGQLGLTDDAETDMICSAVYHHDDKLAVDSPMDEVLKDADVIHHCMNDLSKAVKNKEKARFDSLCREFGM